MLHNNFSALTELSVHEGIYLKNIYKNIYVLLWVSRFVLNNIVFN